MRKNIDIKFNKDADKIMEQIALENMKINGIEVTCPICGKRTRISQSGDPCKFCGTIFEFGTESDV